MRRKPGVNEKTVHRFAYMFQSSLGNELKRYKRHMKRTGQMTENGAMHSDEQQAYYKGYKDALSYSQHLMHKMNSEFANVMKEKDAPIEKVKKIPAKSPKVKEIKFDIKLDFKFPDDNGDTLTYLMNNEMTKALLNDNTMRLVLSPYSYRKFPFSAGITNSTGFNTVKLENAIGLVKEIDLQRCIIKVRVQEEEVIKFFNGKLMPSEWEAHMRVVRANYSRTVGELPTLLHGGRLICFDLVKKEG